ncbi:uncharacterized protein AB675_7786 [Cyphellophora attinorum]|uniref:RING-type domain-containing protein n=1 Tax=Cyphellophora attinorum TaxID=1664694 RepID=A0A0N0NMF0_9EURO|nr:uncharacterized protein AB675_7786 [Phialophora attinorum]KPI40278.1 hypothetical protein AB675_7786 [Phialophora attinorum]
MEFDDPTEDQIIDRQPQSSTSARTPITTPNTGRPAFITNNNIPSPEICVICLDLLYPPPTAHADFDGTEDRAIGEAKETRQPTDPGSPVALATAVPCQHAQFHFPCLGTWLTHSRCCPLCKVVVTAIALRHQYRNGIREGGSEAEVIPLPFDIPSQVLDAADLQSSDVQRRNLSSRQDRWQRRQGRTAPKPHARDPIAADPVLRFRRTLYERQIPSLYCGRGVTRSPPIQPADSSSGLISQSFDNATTTRLTSPAAPRRTNARATTTSQQHHAHQLKATHHHKRSIRPTQISPSSFHPSNPSSAPLLRLAKIWIRRELSLFSFLNPTAPATSHHHHTAHSRRPRPTTAPFLTNFVLAILTQLDLSGAGDSFQAVDLLAEYLGGSDARLFVYELKAFLNSGCGTLREWDEEVAMYWFEDEGEVRDGVGTVLGRV